MIKIFKKAKILEKSQIWKLVDFVNQNKGSTFFQRYTHRHGSKGVHFPSNSSSNIFPYIIIHLIIKVKMINMAIVAL
jgi:hypothetical protein